VDEVIARLKFPDWKTIMGFELDQLLYLVQLSLCASDVPSSRPEYTAAGEVADYRETGGWGPWLYALNPCPFYTHPIPDSRAASKPLKPKG
jgi:hypothetical protein